MASSQISSELFESLVGSGAGMFPGALPRYSDLRHEIQTIIIKGCQVMCPVDAVTAGSTGASGEYRTPSQMADELVKVCQAAAAAGPGPAGAGTN